MTGRVECPNLMDRAVMESKLADGLLVNLEVCLHRKIHSLTGRHHEDLTFDNNWTMWRS